MMAYYLSPSSIISDIIQMNVTSGDGYHTPYYRYIHVGSQSTVIYVDYRTNSLILFSNLSQSAMMIIFYQSKNGIFENV